MPVFPRGPARVRQAALALEQIWLVEPSGIGACLGPGVTASGEPLVVGLSVPP